MPRADKSGRDKRMTSAYKTPGEAALLDDKG